MIAISASSARREVNSLQNRKVSFFCIHEGGGCWLLTASVVHRIARLVKTLMGGWCNLFTQTKGGKVIIYRGMAYAKMFYGGWCCFSGGRHPPSTRALSPCQQFNFISLFLYLGQIFARGRVYCPLLVNAC